jgi:hypothetical protein
MEFAFGLKLVFASAVPSRAPAGRVALAIFAQRCSSRKNDRSYTPNEPITSWRSFLSPFEHRNC